MLFSWDVKKKNIHCPNERNLLHLYETCWSCGWIWSSGTYPDSFDKKSQGLFNIHTLIQLQYLLVSFCGLLMQTYSRCHVQSTDSEKSKSLSQWQMLAGCLCTVKWNLSKSTLVGERITYSKARKGGNSASWGQWTGPLSCVYGVGAFWRTFHTNIGQNTVTHDAVNFTIHPEKGTDVSWLRNIGAECHWSLLWLWSIAILLGEFVIYLFF